MKSIFNDFNSDILEKTKDFDLDKISHIVCLSGGKDSTALALRLREKYPDVNFVFVCTPTGDEYEEMFDHWNNLEKILGQEIIRLKYMDLEELIYKEWMLPNFRARFCTRILKIEAIQEFYEEHKPAIVYVGLRADEPEEDRAGNQIFDSHIVQDYPMRRWGWTINDVWKYLDGMNIEIPRRTDCKMCFFQRLDEWYYLWETDIKGWKRIEDLEFMIGHSLLSPNKFPGWPHWLFELRCEFEKGRMPQAVKRAKKEAGRLKLFGEQPDEFAYHKNQKCRVCSM